MLDRDMMWDREATWGLGVGLEVWDREILLYREMLNKDELRCLGVGQGDGVGYMDGVGKGRCWAGRCWTGM